MALLPALAIFRGTGTSMASLLASRSNALPFPEIALVYDGGAFFQWLCKGHLVLQRRDRTGFSPVSSCDASLKISELKFGGLKFLASCTMKAQYVVLL